MTVQDTLIGREAERVPAGTGSLPALFAAQASRTPDAVALVDGDRSLTYAQLEARATRFAHRLVELGVRAEDRVGVLLDRSAEFVVSELAISMAGGVYVPLDVRAPESRLRLLLAGSGVSLLVTGDPARTASIHSGPTVGIGEHCPELRGPLPPVDAEQLAYLMHTSGSTGVPKGVAARHCDVAALAADSRFATDAHRRVLLHSPVAFDASTYELWVPLLNGGTVVVAPPGDLDVESLRRVISRHRVTGLFLTSGLFRVVAQETPDCFRGLAEVWTGGDVVPPAAVRRVLESCPGLTVVDVYGPTETTTFATCHPMRSVADVAEPIPIGRPLDDMRVQILDGDLGPVPRGEAGELHLAGAGLARGYWGRPGLTAEKFVADPSGPPGERMYRTGDIVRWTGDGELEFLGRADEQVKIRGFRVEPGEIETVLFEHAAVGQAVVLVREDRPGVKRLVAYVVALSDVTPDELVAHTAAALPDYMVPSAFVFLDRLPLSANGKVDRRALPAPLAEPGSEYVAPRTDVERAIARIMGDVLGIERVGLEDDFFALGADSILAVQALARLHAEFGTQLPVRALFDAPNVGALARMLPETPATTGEPILPTPPAEVLPLSPAQRRLWFLDELTGGSVEYNTGVGMRLSGSLDVGKLRAALNALCARHESLRTTFDSVDGKGVQRIAPTGEIPFRIDTATVDDQVLEAELGKPFDLRTGPLTRAVLYPLDDGDHLLLLCQHHIVTDGWSIGLLTAELMDLYAGVTLPPRTLDYHDYTAWHHHRVESTVDEQLGYWRARLDGLEPLGMPTDRPRPQQRTIAGAIHRHHLSADLVHRLTDLGRDHGATLFMTLAAAVQILLSRYGGQRDIALGTAVSGRDRAELEHLTGFFVNTLVLRSQVDEDRSFTDFLGAVRETTLDAFAHGDVPFDRVVDEIQPERDPSRTPLVQAAVVLQQPMVRPREAGGLRVTEYDLPRPSARFDLIVEFWPRDGGLTVAVEYNTDLFDGETVERLARHLEVLLGGIAENPHRTLGALPLLTGEDRRFLLQTGTTDFRSTETIPTLFAAQAARTPDATAVICGEVRLNYRELEVRANRLARRLIRLGVGPEQRVGVLMDRSADLIVAVLAIVKAGGAYLPLDLRAPADRMRLILTGTSILLTDGRWRDTATTVHSGPTVLVRDVGEFDEAPEVELSPDNLAYVEYTSGSTGVPKGVAARHCDVVALAAESRFRGHERVLAHSPLAFDASTYELWVPLLNGGTVVVAPPGDLDAEALHRLVAGSGVTAIFLTSGLFRVFAQEMPGCFAGLREIWTGGDVVPPGAVRRVLESCPGTAVVDVYGPTETTTFATCFRIPGADSVPDPVPIGSPLDGMRVFLLDAQLRPVPRGALGEVCIAGAGLARGYLGRPGLTADRFVANPFGVPGERMYRTGDIARWRTDGAIEFAGRTDHQVKIRGFRVEPGEIERALTANPAVRQAVVTARVKGGRKHLVAYVVSSEKDTVDTDALRRALARTLPDYMIPSAIMALPELPLDANGKVDRRALPEPRFDATAGQVAPRTEAERVLAGIWADVLGLERVGVDDNFFAVGGDSILSIQVSARARRAGLELSTSDLFRHQTIAALALAIGEIDAEPARGPVSGDVVLTPNQRRFFETDRVPERVDQTIELELADGVDCAALANALSTLSDHHDALRTIFWCEGGEWRQEIQAPDADHSLLRWSVSEAGESRILRLTAHRLVVDAGSWRILLEDLDRAYHQLALGEPVDLGPRTTSFQEWAARLAEHTAAGGFDDELNHWRAAGADRTIPVDGTGPNTVGVTRAVTVRLSAAETAALLRDVPGAYRTQVNDALLTALGHVLGGWAGHPVPVDIEGHGREGLFDGVDLSRTVGWFTSVFPVVLDIPDGWGRALKLGKEQMRSVPRHGIGYGALRYLAGTAPAIDPQVGFGYLEPFDLPGTIFAGIRSEPSLHADPTDARPHLIDILGRVDGDALEFTWHYAEGVHRESTITALAEAMLDALRQIVRHCAEPGAGGRTPSDFPLVSLDQSTIDELVGDGRDVEDIYPLTPMQSGMVFHGLTQSAERVYFQQVSFVLDGASDPAALERAWQDVVDRTPVLRTQIVWQGVPDPVQVVRRQVTVPVTHHDWRELTEAECETAWQEVLDNDSAQGLDVNASPLLRLVLARLSDTRVRVLWTFHHVLLDGWSVFKVMSDVFAAYAGAEPPQRPPFRDYLAWLEEQDTAQAEEHWRRVLGDLTAPARLPFDRAPAHAHTSCSSRWLRVEVEKSARLREAARRAGLTLNTIVQGAWAVLLARVTGEADICFGTTVSGRPVELPGAGDITGIFINTLPVRVTVGGGDSADWLAELQAEQVEARHHGQLALSRIQALSGVPAGTSLFDSLVVFENIPVDDEAAAAHGLRLRDVEAKQTPNYPLCVIASPGDRLSIDLGYDPDLFDAATAERLVRQLTGILDAFGADLSQPLNGIDLLTDAERHQVLVAWNDTAHPLPDGGLAELFATQVRRTPDAVALTGDFGSLTYAELDAQANRLAHRLLALGVRPEDRVAVLMERSPALLAAELAIIKAGGAYLPLDLRAPADRLRLLLRESDAGILITDAVWHEVAQSVHNGHIVLDADDEPDAAPAVATHPDQLAYVIYTSGSTGTPKGVAVRHRDVAALAFDRRFAAHDRVLLHSPQAFDASTYELWAPLLTGGTVVVAPPGDLDAEAVQRLSAAHRVTAMWLTAGLFRLFAQEMPECFRGVREVWTGGEAVPVAALRRVRQACPKTRIVDGYGPTETTTFATSQPLPGEIPDVVPIGKPLDNMRAYVLGGDLRPVPPGVPGELHVAGEGLARGYLGRPGMTADRFIASPFGVPGERMYRTGDVVRWNNHGELEFVGRVDDQVKVRGFRIEPSEIEAALSEHPDVAQAAVLAREDSGVKRLVAYVVGETGGLAEFLARTLPDYMIPAAFVRLEELPLNVNGKLDRHALPAPDFGMAAYVPPRTERERILADIWAEVLHVERVGAQDDFFSLGGDSILSIQVVSRARRAGLDLTPGDLFAHRTLASLAAAAKTAEVAVRGPVSGPVPLTPIQRWFFESQTAEPDRFHQLVHIGLDPADAAAARKAVDALLEHHDALRMHFAEGRQYNGPVGAEAPQVRAEVSEKDLMLAIHHLVVDGVSWRVLLEDFHRAYDQALRGEPIDLGPRTTSFQEWATRLTRYAEAGGFDDELGHWRGLTGTTELPVDGEGESTVASMRSVTVRLDPRETGALLRDVPDVYRTEINDVLLTALGRVLQDWTGQCVLIDLEGHGREDLFDGVDLSRTVGWFTTVFPVALAVPDGWGSALKSVKEQLRAVPRRGIGYGALRYLTGTAPAIDPQVSFNYLGQFASGHLETDLSPRSARAHLLDVVGRVEHGELEFTWYYAEGVHRESTVTTLAEAMLGALRQIVRHCAEPGSGGRTPSDFPLVRLDQSTIDKLIGDGRDVEDVYPLTPMQSGMVFHGLSQSAERVYFQQVWFTLDGVRDPAALERAWQQVVDRTPVLRTQLVWQGVPEPIQVVRRHVTLPVTHHDWRQLSESERERAWQGVLDADRAEGLDLTAAPLQRVVLARLSDTEVRVLWTFHHVLLDGWSVFGVFSDIFAAYAGHALPERRPFRDYLAWLGEQDTATAEEYWRRALGDLTAPARLPFDRAPADVHRTRSSSWLRVECSARLGAAARRAGLTLNTILQGAWALLLARITGESDICFGTTVSGRPVELAGADDITGIFINTLPVRVTVGGGDSAEWLTALQTEQVEARRYGHLALSRIQAFSGVPAGASLFDSLIVFENYPIDDEAAAAHGLRLRDVDAVETPNYPLCVVAAPGDRLSIKLGYDPDLFDAATAERFARQLTGILDAFAADVSQPLSGIDLLTDSERHQVLAAWNDTTHPVPQGNLAELFSAQVRHTPDAVALTGDFGSLTYAELDARADRLARYLVSLGAGVETLVGVLMERSPDLVVAELAIVKAGAAYLPLDIRAPEERLKLFLNGVSILIADKTWEPVARSVHKGHLVVPNGQSAEVALPEAHPDNLAYVIYTSGSTGTPKGVAARQRDVIALAHDRRFATHDRVLLHSPQAFDASTYEMWVPLLRGGSVVVAPAGDADVATLRRVIVEQRVTAMFMTTGLFRLMAQEAPECFAAVREVWTGGDAVPAAALRSVRQACPGTLVADVYGPTETTTFATVHPMPGEIPDVVPIGKPLDNMRTYVLGRDLRPVPPGVPGELHIAGEGLARGYFGSPGLTADRFLADPFGPPGERMYRTGDIVRWSNQGELEFVGRVDDQVKIRGFRIEPSEIEAALAEHPDVTQAAVVVREDQPGAKQLVAYVVSDADTGVLRSFLARVLPDYMVPAAFVPLDRLPLNRNGKLDRAALPAPMAATNGYVAPATDTERALAEIWAEVLGVERVGAEDGFFALGGDSLKSLAIAAKASAAFDVRLTPADVLTGRTVAGLAGTVEELILTELERLAADHQEL